MLRIQHKYYEARFSGPVFFFFSFVFYSKIADLALGSDRMGAITQLLLAAVAYSNLALQNHAHSVQLPGVQSAHWLPSAAKGSVAAVYIIVLWEKISRTNDVNKASDVMGVACMVSFSLVLLTRTVG